MAWCVCGRPGVALRQRLFHFTGEEHGSRKAGQKAGQSGTIEPKSGTRLLISTPKNSGGTEELQGRTQSFGYWLRRRRKALDLTQEALAQRVSCSGFSIRKIEADERRPSRRLAERLAAVLAIPEEERRDFLDAARAVRTADRLQLEPTPVTGDAHAAVPGPSTPLPVESAIGSTSDTTPFVGRSNEYGLLTGLIARLTVGTGYTVLIEGEPGIGKSRLMREGAR